MPVYRGDIVNAPEFTVAARTPDPRRMIKAHARSAMTMNFVRALIDGGFADLHHPEYWDLGWVGHSPLADEYQRMVAGIGDAVRFMETLSGAEVHNLNRVDFYTSHEALLLPYEEAQTREVPRQWGWFNLGTHFPWIGMRTAALDGAHVEYFRGIRNPIALKVGPSVTPDQLLRLIDVLNPRDEPGRLTLIHRMGAAQHRRETTARCSTPCAAKAAACCGSAIRCTATPKPPATATRRGASTTSAANSSRRSNCMPPPARAWAACIWSSPAKTSPNASVVRAN